jgi:hypothetical protein
VLALVLVGTSHGQTLATARADLVAQGTLALAMGIAFVAIHHKHRGNVGVGGWLRRQHTRHARAT